MDLLTICAASIRNRVGESDQAIEDMSVWMQLANLQGAELVLFPELNVSGYFPATASSEIAETVPGPSTDKIIHLAAQYHQTIAFGLIEREGKHLYCTHVLVDEHGIIGKQRKIHVPAQEQPYWEAGNAIEVFDIGKAKLGIAICRDAFFDEMIRTFYFKGAEILLMPFGYYNVPRNCYLTDSIHGKSLIKSAWANGMFEVVCNSAENRSAGEYDPIERQFPGWAGVIDPWGKVLEFVDQEGNQEAMVVQILDPTVLNDRRSHPNFLAQELRLDLYQFAQKSYPQGFQSSSGFRSIKIW